MAAKKKIGPEERAERRKRAIRNRMNRALGDLGVDVTSVPASDREAIDLADQNVRKLRSIADKMNVRRSPSDPTEERVRHAGVDPRAIEVQVDQPRAHKFDWIIDSIQEKLSARQYQAAERLRDRHEAMQAKSAVASLDGASTASDPSGRLPITEAQEIAAREFAWVTDRIEPIFMAALDAFVLEKPPEGADRCLTIAEYGTKVSKIAGENQGRAAGVVAIKLACARLAALWWAYDSEQREQCARTDRLMRSEIGRRAAAQGWICALHDWCRKAGRLPATQGEMDTIRAIHNETAMRLRKASQLDVDRHTGRNNRLVAKALMDDACGRVRVA